MIDSSAPNQPIQNYEIVNSTLETQVASLLPSVAGYGGNLRSTNTIIPIIDLTSAAEGTTLPENLQQAMAFGSQTAHSVNNTTGTIINNTGFFRVFGNTSILDNQNGDVVKFLFNDGSSTKVIWTSRTYGTNGTAQAINIPVDFIVFIDTGVTFQVTATGTYAFFDGTTRQLASKDGTRVDPAGYS
jgi:hypothetical protein